MSKRFGFRFAVIFALVSVLVSACHSPADRAQREKDAKTLFDRTVKEFHLPSANAAGAKKTELLARAADGYSEILSKYEDLPFWASQAMRSLGNVRVEQGRLDDAVKLYDKVVARFPKEEWEVLQSLKSAGDLLWDHDQRPSAAQHYREIVARFGQPEQAAVVKIIVRVAQKRAAQVTDDRLQR
jgi:TolA-binding protein